MNSATRQEDLVEFLSELVRIPSVKAEPADAAPFGLETVRALECFLQRAEQDGFRVGRSDGYAGYLEFGPEQGEMVAAVCHLDVVPAGDWEEAFEPRLADHQLIGRGTADDKGPAVACYFALKELLDEGYRPARRMRLILGLDEESGSACMKHYCAHEQLPYCAFTADADFPVIHAEKGLLQFRFSFQRDPGASAFLIDAEAGERANVVPGSCRIRFNRDHGIVERHFEGRAAHASEPQQGINAIALAVRDLAEEAEHRGIPLEPVLRLINERIGEDYTGAGLGIACSDEVSGPLTFNAAVLRVDDKTASLVCDIRYPVTADSAAVIARLKSVASEYGAEFAIEGHSEPLYLPKDHPLIDGLLKIYNKISGTEAQPLAIGGGTYARSIPNTVAFGSVFPGEQVLMHQTGEAQNVVNLLRSVEYYKEAFKMMDHLQMPTA